MYISKKKSSQHTGTIFLKHDGDNKIKVVESDFGPFTITITESKNDTLFWKSSVKEMKVKYIKSSRRITFISMVDGQRVNFNGKFSHRDEKDLAALKAKNEAILKAKKEEIRYYGVFYGSVELKNSDKVIMDTIIVNDFVRTNKKDNYIIEDKMAKFSSKSGAFKPFDTQIKVMNDGSLITSYLNNSLDLKLNYETNTLYFDNRLSGFTFQGILIEGKSK